MKRETLFLKAVVFLMGLPILALCIFVVPVFAKWLATDLPDWAFLQYPFVLLMYASAIVYFGALYQTIRLLGYIDRNEAFSELSVLALKKIKNCALMISLLHAFNLPIIYVMAEVDDAPGLILIGMVLIFAAFAIAVFAAVLQKLLKNAIAIKSENDLTV